MLEDLGKMLINERRLFHGTSVDVVPDICEEGFDWRLCGKNATRYGKGKIFIIVSAQIFVNAQSDSNELVWSQISPEEKMSRYQK